MKKLLVVSVAATLALTMAFAGSAEAKCGMS